MVFLHLFESIKIYKYLLEDIHYILHIRIPEFFRIDFYFLMITDYY